jgi:type IV pilus assembly protein PilO
MSKKTQQFLIILFIGLVGAFLFYRFGISKKREIRDVKQEEHRTLNVKLNEARGVAAQVEEFREKVRKVEQRWKRAQQMLPQDQEIPSLLKSIAESGVRQNVEILLFQKSSPVQKEHYTEIPVQLQVSGGYHEIGRFLSSIGNLSRIVTVANLKVNPIEEEKVRATFVATTYTLSKVPPKKPRRGG